MPTALSYLQYIYGTFVKSLNIHKECQNIKLNKNVKRLNLLKRRLEKTLILMPSKYDPNYEGKVELQFNFDKEIDYSVKYMDRRGIFQEGVDDENGTKGFIQAVHDCCDEYLKIIDTLELELSE